MKIDNLNKLNNWLLVSPIFLIILIAVSFSLGWLFPVEGPIDYIYDEHVGQKTMKAPIINVATKDEYILQNDVKDVKEIYIDLNDDGELEWYLFLPIKGSK